MTKSIKICNKCHAKNDVNVEICKICGNNIIMVMPVVDFPLEYSTDSEELLWSEFDAEKIEREGMEKILHNNKESKERVYRICRVCGTYNYIEVGREIGVCINCGNDELHKSEKLYEVEVLRDIGQSERMIEDVVEAKISARLVAKKDGYVIELKENRVILGRMGDVDSDYFDKYDYVGRIHAEIWCENSVWYIKDLKSTNKTFVNGEALQADSSYRIQGGDTISLANAHFKFETS